MSVGRVFAVGLFSLGSMSTSATPQDNSARNSLQLRAEAGLGAICRAGRWVPVRIWIDNDERDISGDLIVQWGRASVRRRVEIARPSRGYFELYIRTTDVRGAMLVRLQSAGIDLQTVEIPVHIVGFDEPVRICIARYGQAATSTSECSATIAPETMPQSLRGYDAADEVLFRGDFQSELTGRQRTALTAWRHYRELEADGLLGALPRANVPTSPVHGFSDAVRAMTVLYLGFLITICVLGQRSARSPSWVYGALFGSVAAFAAASLVPIRFGPMSMVTVRHGTVFLQLSSEISRVVSRGTVQYPAFDTFAVSAELNDAAVEDRSIQDLLHFDEDDHPLLVGTFGRGTAREFTLEGTIDFSPTVVRPEGGSIRVTNASADALDDCRFPEGFSREWIGTVASGESALAAVERPVGDPFFTCTLHKLPFEFIERRYGVRTVGPVVLAVYLPRPTGGDRAQP